MVKIGPVQIAIVLVVIVIAAVAIYDIGVNVGPGSPADIFGGCTPSPAFSCLPPISYSQSGTFVFSFRYNNASNVTLYNIQLSCVSSKPVGNRPPQTAKFQNLSASGYDNLTQSALPSASWQAGQLYHIINVKCYNSSNASLSPVNGTVAVYLWLNYTLKNGKYNSTSNPWMSTEIAFVTGKVT